MRSLTGDQTASFTSELLTIAVLLDLTLSDGRAVKLTDHDVDVGAYRAGFGLDASNIVVQLGGVAQTLTVATLPDTNDTTGVSILSVEKDLVDGAQAVVSLIDWNTPGAVPLVLVTGTVTEVTYGNSGTLVLSIATPLSQSRSLCKDTMSQLCRADFGDSKCGVDITNMIDGPAVAQPVDAQSFLVTRDETSPPGYYNNGTVAFIDGPNKGLGYEVQSFTASGNNMLLVTKVPFAFDPVAGNRIALYPGCDKIIDSGCTYWNNTANFQGEPFTADLSDLLPAPVTTGDA